MDRQLLLQLLAVLVLLVLNALFAGSEIALISLRESQVARLARTGRRGAALAKLVGDPNAYLATIQIGITLAGFLASATAAVSLAEPLVPLLGFLGAAAPPVAIIVVTLVLTYVTLVVGELMPKRIAMQRGEGWALRAARPLALLAQVSRPVVWLLGKSTDGAVRLLGADPGAGGEEVSEEELRDLLASRTGFTRTQRMIVEGAFELGERRVRDIVVPRAAVFALDAATTSQDAARALATRGHSRAPVVRDDDLDEIVGVVHLRDLVDAQGSVGAIARPPTSVPETVGVLDLLRLLQRERQHLAVVVDEYGATTGIVTLEDVLEELVGEIYDEFDRDVRQVRRQPDGTLELVGTFPVHDLHDLGVELPAGEYTTIAGLVLARTGHLPLVGDSVTVEGWVITVTAADARAIRRVELRRSDEAPPLTDPQ